MLPPSAVIFVKNSYIKSIELSIGLIILTPASSVNIKFWGTFSSVFDDEISQAETGQPDSEQVYTGKTNRDVSEFGETNYYSEEILGNIVYELKQEIVIEADCVLMKVNPPGKVDLTLKLIVSGVLVLIKSNILVPND